MQENHAKTLAVGLDAEWVDDQGEYSVLYTRRDGRCVQIQDDHAWIYRDRAAYDVWHAGGLLDEAETSFIDYRWDGSRAWAQCLAEALGGEAWDSGGGIWLVMLALPDGQFQCIGEGGVGLYPSIEVFRESEEDGTWRDFEWEDDDLATSPQAEAQTQRERAASLATMLGGLIDGEDDALGLILGEVRDFLREVARS